MRTLIAILFSFVSISAFAQSIAVGDLAIINPLQCCTSVGGFISAKLLVLDDTGALRRDTGVIASAIVLGPNGHVFVGIGPSVTEYDESVKRLWTWSGAQRDNVLSLAYASNGNLYALTFNSDVIEFSADSSSTRRIALPGVGFPVAIAGIDLAGDNCTLYYFDHGATIQRYDICSGNALAPLVPGRAFESFRVLADGGVVAARNKSLEFYDRDGHLLKSIVVTGAPAVSISFDADPAYVWAGVPQFIAKVRISDGTIVRSFPHLLDVIAVRGERRPASVDITGSVRKRGARH